MPQSVYAKFTYSPQSYILYVNSKLKENIWNYNHVSNSAAACVNIKRSLFPASSSARLFRRQSWPPKNSQTSRYYVAEGEAKAELEKCLAEFNRKNSKDAPVLIVSTVVTKRSGFTREGEYETHLKDGFQYYDHGMQAMNLCLKAHELGLATLIMGIYDEAAIRKLFAIPPEQAIVAVIAVGYPEGETAMPKRKSVDDITVFAERF